MSYGFTLFALLQAVAVPAAQGAGPSLEGRWDLSIQGLDQQFPGWLEVRREKGGLVGRLQWGWGHATPVANVAVEGNRFRFLWPDESNPKASASQVSGSLTHNGPAQLAARVIGGDGKRFEVSGVLAPRLASVPSDTAAWGAPVNLLAAGLVGWRARGEQNGWTITDGVLANTLPSSDLVSLNRFRNFKLHLEVEVPPGGNSGIYLRGRHEVQVLDSYGKPTGSREMGGVYGQVTPTINASRPAGEWQAFDITFTGRRVKEVLNGQTIIDFEEIPGITGGALDSEEGLPGPLMLQGDHTGIRYRNIVVTPAVVEGPAEREVRQFELRRFAAMVGADTAALRHMLADELSYTHSNARVETKAIHLAGIGAGRTIYQSLTPIGITYQRLGETVLGNGVVKAQGVLAGDPFDVLLRVTTIHVRRESGWELVGWQSTRMP